MPTTSPVALSDDEYDVLGEILDDFSSFDVDGILGLFHAVDDDALKTFFGLLMRLYNEVIDALAHGAVMMPEPEDVAGCESFCVGYVAAAERENARRPRAPRVGSEATNFANSSAAWSSRPTTPSKSLDRATVTPHQARACRPDRPVSHAAPERNTNAAAPEARAPV